LRVSNNPPHFLPRVTTVDTLDFVSLQEYVDEHGQTADQTCFEEDGWSLAGKATQDLLAKIRQNSIPLGEYVNGKVYRGILTGLNKAFVIDQATKDRLIAEDPRSAELIKPFAQGKDVKRYAQIPVKQYLIFTRRGVKINNYLAIKAYLSQFKDRLKPKPANWKGPWKGRKPGKYEWYEIQDSIDYHEEFSKPKIVYPDISLRGNFTFDLNGVFFGNTTYMMPVDDLFLLGLLNSELFDFYNRQIFASYRGGYLRFFSQYITQLPIIRIVELNRDQLVIHKKIIDLVTNLLEMNRQQPSYPREEEQLKNIKIEIEKQINLQIYKLYDLNSEEIRLVNSV